MKNRIKSTTVSVPPHSGRRGMVMHGGSPPAGGSPGGSLLQERRQGTSTRRCSRRTTRREDHQRQPLSSTAGPPLPSTNPRGHRPHRPRSPPGYPGLAPKVGLAAILPGHHPRSRPSQESVREPERPVPRPRNIPRRQRSCRRQPRHEGHQCHKGRGQDLQRLARGRRTESFRGRTMGSSTETTPGVGHSHPAGISGLVGAPFESQRWIYRCKRLGACAGSRPGGMLLPGPHPLESCHARRREGSRSSPRDFAG